MQSSGMKTEMHFTLKHTIISLLQSCCYWKPCPRNLCLPCLHCPQEGRVFEEEPYRARWGCNPVHLCPSWISQQWRLTLAPWQAGTALSFMLFVREAKLSSTHKQAKYFTACILNWPNVYIILSLVLFFFFLSQLFSNLYFTNVC